MTTYENKLQPLLVTILASAISSVGYGVSVFAIGIIWLLPSVKPAAPVLVMPKSKPRHHRRRSAPPVLQGDLSRPPLPSLISNKSQSSADNPRTPLTRRVYFVDSAAQQIPPDRSSRRYTAPPEQWHKSIEPSHGSIGTTSNVPLDASPRSSSSTLVHEPLPPTPPSPPGTSVHILDANPKSESIESDTSRPGSSSSSRPSLSISPRFPTKIWSRKSAGRKALANHATDSGGEATHSDEPSCSAMPSTPASRHKRKAASLGFSWPTSKNKALPDTATTPSSSPKIPIDVPPKQDCPCTPSSITSFVRSSKQQRQVSAPLRARTQPYAYPYFALPPTVAGGQPTTAMSSAAVSNSNTSSGPEGAPNVGEAESTTTAHRRQQNVVAQESLGIGRRKISQRRAMSEGSALAL
ncbi:hypothetical protein F5876DRAFT_64031 [Lentinula aff. lateritia]|uniref:Uncharacterized protein n=1 Tax=Lentinula aff. lateritia TaxID=2804960 RepID=A0ACC1U6S0_9AGAR|nr:hypothetical protein F5876DRAFT_64031 [Lentinula aff. lateritia]